MKFIVESGSVRFVYRSLDVMSEELKKIFSLLIFFDGSELVRGNSVYRVER